MEYIKKVKLKNVSIVVKACVEHLDERIYLREAIVIFEGKSIVVNDAEIMIYDLSDTLENCIVEIYSDPFARAIISTPKEIYVAFSDGGYAYIVPIDRSILKDLLREE